MRNFVFPKLSLFIAFLFAVQLSSCGSASEESSNSSSSASLSDSLSNENTQARNVFNYFNRIKQESVAAAQKLSNGDTAGWDSYWQDDYPSLIEAATTSVQSLKDSETSLSSMARERGRAQAASRGAPPAGYDGKAFVAETLVGLGVLLTFTAIGLGIGNVAKDQDQKNQEFIDAMTQYLMENEGMSEGAARTKATALALQVSVKGGAIIVSEAGNIIIKEAGQAAAESVLPGGNVKFVITTVRDVAKIRKLLIGVQKGCHDEYKRVLAGRSNAVSSADSCSFYIGESDDGQFGNVPAGDWDFTLFGDGYARVTAAGITVGAGSTTSVSRYFIPIEDASISDITANDNGTYTPGSSGDGGTGEGITFPRTYTGSLVQEESVTGGGSITCSYSNDISVTLNADGTLTGSTTISAYVVASDGGLACSSRNVSSTLSGTHSNGSFSLTESAFGIGISGTYTSDSMTGSGRYTESGEGYEITLDLSFNLSG